RNPPRPRRKPTYQPYNWRLRYKNETFNETVGSTRNARESASPVHEEPPERPCPCSRCSPHLHPEQTEREPVDWAPAPVVVEPSPEPMRIRRPEGCTCGNQAPCAVCNG